MAYAVLAMRQEDTLEFAKAIDRSGGEQSS
jgi:hypothetical protein